MHKRKWKSQEGLPKMGKNSWSLNVIPSVFGQSDPTEENTIILERF